MLCRVYSFDWAFIGALLIDSQNLADELNQFCIPDNAVIFVPGS